MMTPFKTNTNLLNRKIQPEIRKIDIISIQRAELDNYFVNNRVFFIHNNKQPICRIEWIYNAGLMYHKNSAVPYLTAKMISEGTKNYSASDIQEKIAFEGAFFNSSISGDRVIFSLNALNANLKNLKNIFLEIFTEPSFGIKELEIQKEVAIQNLKINKEKTSFLATQMFKKNLWGKHHPLTAFYEVEDIQKTTPSDLKAFFKQHYSYFDIIVAGNYDDNVKDFLREIIEYVNLKKPNNYEIELPNHEPISSELEKPDAIQSSLRLGYKTIPRNHKDWHKLCITNEILGGYFGSRLMKNIRENKGLTYGIGSQIVTSNYGNYWVISSEIRKEQKLICLNEIKHEINKLIQDSVCNNELETVTNYMRGNFLASLSTPFALADIFKTLYFSNLDYTYFENFLSELNSITSFDVQKIAEQYLSKYIYTIVG
jgi:zinc protease